MRDSYTNIMHSPSHEMWSYERDGRCGSRRRYPFTGRDSKKSGDIHIPGINVDHGKQCAEVTHTQSAERVEYRKERVWCRHSIMGQTHGY